MMNSRSETEISVLREIAAVMARERNVRWRIDYFLVSEGLQDKLTAASIHTDVLGSDHCPVSIEIY